MQYLLILDSFKGSISSADAALHIKSGLGKGEIIPFSDGGEGFMQSVEALCGGKRVYLTVPDSYGREIKTRYLRIKNTAVIETALADGLVTVGKDHPNIIKAASVGTGKTVLKALEDGCKKIIIGFGGSAVNDGGTGALYALGARFYNGSAEVYPGGLCGEECTEIDISGVTPLLNGAEMIFACDVENPFYGENGASLVYSPQKGADKETALRMDKSHVKLAETIKRCTGRDISHIPGAGAAGGLTGGLLAVCDAEIKSGFDVIADLCNLEEKIKQADIIITGEGKTDGQTLNGKLPKKVFDLAKKHSKTVCCVSGIITEEGYGLGADTYISLSHGDITPEMTIRDPAPYLKKAGENIKNKYEGKIQK